jgi:hypothetical protein
MMTSSLSAHTFKLFKITSSGTIQVTNDTVSLSTDGVKATLNPFGTSTTNLTKGAKYKAVVTTRARDVTGNPLDQNPTTIGSQKMVWFFTVR